MSEIARFHTVNSLVRETHTDCWTVAARCGTYTVGKHPSRPRSCGISERMLGQGSARASYAGLPDS